MTMKKDDRWHDRWEGPTFVDALTPEQRAEYEAATKRRAAELEQEEIEDQITPDQPCESDQAGEQG